jgi:hypothetical protein
MNTINGKTKLWIIVGSIAFIVVASLSFGYYQYTKVNTDPANEKPEVFISASALLNDFVGNEERATAKYSGKLTCTRGVLKSIDKNGTDMASIALDAGSPAAEIFCQLDPRHTSDLDKLSPGDTIEVQGVCAGMLNDVLIVECSARLR